MPKTLADISNDTGAAKTRPPTSTGAVAAPSDGVTGNWPNTGIPILRELKARNISKKKKKKKGGRGGGGGGDRVVLWGRKTARKGGGVLWVHVARRGGRAHGQDAAPDFAQRGSDVDAKLNGVCYGGHHPTCRCVLYGAEILRSPLNKFGCAVCASRSKACRHGTTRFRSGTPAEAARRESDHANIMSSVDTH